MIRNSEIMKRVYLLLAVLVVIVMGALISIGFSAVNKTTEEDDEFYRFADVMTEIYWQIKNKHVNEVEKDKLFEASIQGMFLMLDPYSQYLDPDALELLERDTEGEFSGVGIVITIKDGVLTVVSPISGTPAARLGIRPWDRIVEIDGKPTKGITLIEAVKKLTGPSGTKVRINVYRNGAKDLIPYTITREKVKIESVYSKVIDSTIGLIRITRFSDNTAPDLKKVLLSFADKGIKGIILDLRDNPGGLLNQAVAVSDLFLPKDLLIVSTQGRIDAANKKYYSRHDPITDSPLAVLINSGTASGSEIVVGALKDHRRALVVGPKGKKTFGKGVVQTISQLDYTMESDVDGNPRASGLRLTTAEYYTPDNTKINEKGIIPDIEVPLPENHETELIEKGGLLGEPSYEEPKEQEEVPEKSSEDRLTLESEKEEAPDETEGEKFYIKKKEKENEKEPFIDIQLDYAVRFMKSHLIMSGVDLPSEQKDTNDTASLPSGE